MCPPSWFSALVCALLAAAVVAAPGDTATRRLGALWPRSAGRWRRPARAATPAVLGGLAGLLVLGPAGGLAGALVVVSSVLFATGHGHGPFSAGSLEDQGFAVRAELSLEEPR